MEDLILKRFDQVRGSWRRCVYDALAIEQKYGDADYVLDRGFPLEHTANSIETAMFATTKTKFRHGLALNLFEYKLWDQVDYLAAEKFRALTPYIVVQQLDADCTEWLQVRRADGSTVRLPRICVVETDPALGTFTTVNNIEVDACSPHGHRIERIDVPYTNGDLVKQVFKTGITLRCAPIVVRRAGSNGAVYVPILPADIPTLPHGVSPRDLQTVTLSAHMRIIADCAAAAAGAVCATKKPPRPTLPIKFSFRYDFEELRSWGHRAGWYSVMQTIKNAEVTGTKKMLLVDIIEKTFSWDVTHVLQTQNKDIYFENRTYSVPMDTIRLKDNGCQIVHLDTQTATTTAAPTYIKWDGARWVRDAEEQAQKHETRRRVTDFALTEPFVGIMHNPPGMPLWFDHLSSPEELTVNPFFTRSYVYCKCILVFSRHLAAWLTANLPVPRPRVVALYHPTETPDSAFDFTFERFAANADKQVIQVGWWLRRMTSICALSAPGYRKVWLYGSPRAFDMLQKELLYTTSPDFRGASPDFRGASPDFRGASPDFTDVTIQRVTDGAYDLLLSQNVLFLDLYCSSVNNAVIEAIVRKTPVLINRDPAVVEYLGEDYPMYFDSLEEAGRKLACHDTVRAAHEYLVAHRELSDRLTYAHFMRSLKAALEGK